jgi:hypothetical protein
MSEHRLDIFRVLKQADLKNAEFYGKLTDDERKAFQPFLATRWLSGTYSARQIYFLNEIVNQLVFSLAGHKQLLWYLLTICTSGKPQRYIWNKLPSKATISRPASTKVLADYYGYSTQRAAQALLCLTGNDVLTMAETLGLQTEELAKIRKEYKDEQLKADHLGSTTKTKTKTKHEQVRDDFFEF